MAPKSVSAEKTTWLAPDHVEEAVVISREQYDGFQRVVEAARPVTQLSKPED